MTESAVTPPTPAIKVRRVTPSENASPSRIDNPPKKSPAARQLSPNRNSLPASQHTDPPPAGQTIWAFSDDYKY
jgi:hypothetical protein